MLRRVTLAAVGLVMVLAVAEGALRLLEWRRGRPAAPPPAGPGAVVVLGDSLTRGAGVGASEAWPRKLGALCGTDVDNRGEDGLGPVGYLERLRQALPAGPRVVVIAVHLGDDVYDAYRESAGTEWRPAGDAEMETDSIAPRARELLAQERRFCGAWGRRPADWPTWVRAHTALGRRLDAARQPGAETAWFRIYKAWARAHPEAAAIHDDAEVGTVFRVRYRLLLLDLEDPRILEGLRVARLVLARLGREARDARVPLLVLLLPTKETVYATAMQAGRGRLEGTYEALVRHERRIREETGSLLRGEGIAVVDSLAPLRLALAQGVAVYPATADGRLTPAGYGVVAGVACNGLRERGWLAPRP